MAMQCQDTEISKCGLCLESLNTPQTLPCLHMFCKSCLCDFLLSKTNGYPLMLSGSVSCPVCKTIFPFSGDSGNSKSDSVTLSQRVTEKRKEKDEISNLMHRLDAALGVINDDVEDKRLALQKIKHDKDEVKNKITAFREEINTKMDELEIKYNREYDSVYEQQLIKGDHYQRDVSTYTKENKLQTITAFSTGMLNTEFHNGVKLLPNGKILLCTSTKRYLYLYGNTSLPLKEARIPGKPYDVTVISENEAALSYDPGPLCPVVICIVNIKTMRTKVDDIIRGRGYGHIVGIATYDGNLILIQRDRIDIIDTKGSLIKEIQTPSPGSYDRYVTVAANKTICYTNYWDGSVVCIDMEGKAVFTYRHEELQGPRGVTSDSDGVLYVAGHKSNNTHQISPDGHLLNILLCKTDGVISPYSVHFDCLNNKLVLTHSASYVSVYQVKKK